jgi:hypothetical protein
VKLGDGRHGRSPVSEGVQSLHGYVWLDMPGKVRSVGEHELEFRDSPPD